MSESKTSITSSHQVHAEGDSRDQDERPPRQQCMKDATIELEQDDEEEQGQTQAESYAIKADVQGHVHLRTGPTNHISHAERQKVLGMCDRETKRDCASGINHRETETAWPRAKYSRRRDD